MAYEFTGTTYLDVGNVNAFDLGLSATPFTLAFKFYRGTSGENYYIGKGGGFSGWSTTDGHQWLAVISGGVFYFQVNSGVGTDPVNITATPPSVATWASCAVTYNGSTTTLHINGSTAGTSSVSYSKPTAANRAWIGNITSGESNDARQLAEVAIWQNAALSTAEIAALHTGFTADQIRPQSLSFYAPLVRDLQDVRGGLAITNNNGATVATHPRIIT